LNNGLFPNPNVVGYCSLVLFLYIHEVKIYDDDERQNDGRPIFT